VQNIIGFLSSQNHLLTSTVDSLTATHASLAGARVRNYDLHTALSVLTTGRYDALPSVIRESFAEGEKLGDEEVRGTMREVNEVLRWRLVMGLERVPRGMRGVPWRIGEALSPLPFFRAMLNAGYRRRKSRLYFSRVMGSQLHVLWR
jgi:hypothetical protein